MFEKFISGTAQLMFPDAVWKIRTAEKKIFLTFDDGPCPEITPWIIDLLDKKNAKATFFLVGRNAEKFPTLVNEILAAGHVIGNHTFSHLNGWKTGYKEYINDVLLATAVIKSDIFRPPYGKISPAQYRWLKQKFSIIMWDVLSKDYNYRLPKKICLNTVIQNSKKGSVVVFHDSVKAMKNLKYTLPEMLDVFSARGYSFEPIIAGEKSGQ